MDEAEREHALAKALARASVVRAICPGCGAEYEMHVGIGGIEGDATGAHDISMPCSTCGVTVPATAFVWDID